MNAPTVPTLAQMNERGQAIALAYFEAGRIEGWRAGWDAHEAAEEARWRWIGAQVGKVSEGVPFDELCERRGWHEKAEAHRALMRERGIA